MKIQVLTDLHQEFGFMDISFEGADVVIPAGDINRGTGVATEHKNIMHGREALCGVIPLGLLVRADHAHMPSRSSAFEPPALRSNPSW